MLRSSLSVLALSLSASLAQGGVVLTFDASRCASGAYQYHLTGNGMDGPRAQLLARGHTIQTTSFLTATDLAGVDVFVTSQLPGGLNMGSSEASDLQAWVAAGGSCLVFGEGAVFASFCNQMGALFGGLAHGGEVPQFGVTMTIALPAHPLASGPFGVVTTITGLNTPGRWINAPSGAAVVAVNPDGSAGLIAMSYGSGRVVFTNDVNYFAYPPTYSADHARLWDNTIDWLLNSCGPAASYCTSSTSTHGCVASISANGLLSVAAASGCVLLVDSVEGQKQGLIFYGASGAVAFPWASNSTSFFCAKSPTSRLALQVSGGTSGQCDGAFSSDLRAHLAANPSAIGNPLVAGAKLQAQAWFRDPPAPRTTNLSNAVEVTACP